MRVVNDRRRLPRVAWNGQAVIQTRRGEVRGVGLDLSADGMAVLAPSPGKAKERVRIHMQLGEFPLLTDARVVRMTKRRDGYRWALRFDRMDDRMRANLEAYVRQQLANAARVRQAQLYAQRLKGGVLPTPPPSATPPPARFTPAPAGVPTPAPVDPRIRAGITLPPVDPQELGGPVAPPAPASPAGGEPSLDGLAEVLPQRPLEIELPSMPPGPDQPVLDIADEPPSGQDVYVPYHSSSATDEAALLGEGPMTPAPSQNPPPVAAAPPPPPPPQKPTPDPAEVLAPGVIEISDDEDLSLEDILAEVEAGGTLVPEAHPEMPVSDLQMPPKQDAAEVPTAGLGDVPVLDDDLGDDEDTLGRDAPPIDPTLVKAPPVSPTAAPSLDAALVDEAPALAGAPLLDAPPLDAALVDDAPALAGAPMLDAAISTGAPLSEAPALDGALVDEAPALDGAPMLGSSAPSGAPMSDAPAAEPFEGAGALVGAPMDAAPSIGGEPQAQAPGLESVSLSDAPGLESVSLSDAPGLESVSLSDAPPSTEPASSEAPPLDAGLLDEAPALAGAPFSNLPPSARNTLLPGAPEPASGGSKHELTGVPFISSPQPGDDSAEISLADLAPGMQRAAAQATEIATEPPTANPYATPLPSSPQPYIPVSADGELAGDESGASEGAPEPKPEPTPEPQPQPKPQLGMQREEDAPLPSHVPTPGVNAKAAADDKPKADAGDDEEFPEPPALLDPVDGADAALPSSARTLYPDDAAPFDPYAPNPAPVVGAAPSRLGSAPRALGELPPVVEGLYTPTSNPKITEGANEGSGAYESATFQPFSVEEGLYGGREDVTFEEQQGNPRQRLAVLQQDDKSTHKLAQQHDLFLGDIEGVTSGAAPAAAAAPSKPEAPTAEAADETPEPPSDAEELDFADLDEVEEDEPKHDAVVEGLAAARAEAEQLQAAVPDQELGANAPTSMHGLPELAEMAPTRPIDVDSPPGPEGFTPAPQDLTPAPQGVEGQDHTPAPQELSLDDIELQPDGSTSSASNRGIPPTYPEFNVIPDYDQPVESDSAPSGPEPAQSGHTIVASFEDLGLRESDLDPAAAQPPSAPGDFAVLPSFGGPQIGAGFTMVASFDAEAEADVGASSTMIATAGDIEAWRSAGVASAEPPGADAVIPPEFDEERTGTYTPAPGSLPPLGPAIQAPVVGSPVQDEALTAMRVGRGANPTGAGFELNPRGPAPAPAPAPDRPIPAAPAKVAAPGASSRGQTNFDTAGRPAPPPKPVITAPPPKPDPAAAPPLRGSGSVEPAAVPSTPRRSLVEDALAELKKKTDSKRKKRDTLSPVEEKAKAIAEEKKAAKQERRRRRMGRAEMVDPAIADLYKAAMTDLSRTRE